MGAKNSLVSYGWMMILLHWLMAILIIGMIIVGLYMVELPLANKKLKLYGLHKEIGVIILGMLLFRVFWRFINVQPLLPKMMPGIEVFAARATHYMMYLLLFFMVLSGWMMSSAAGFPVSFFGLFVLPDLIQPNEQWRDFYREMHEYSAYTLIFFIILHTLAALKHHFINKDDVLRKILP